MSKSYDSYDVLYMLEPEYEDLKRGGVGWYKLKWRPIWGHTFYLCRYKHENLFGVRWYRCDQRNGYFRSYRHLEVYIGIPFFILSFWIKWDFMCHKEGPSDVRTRKPLDLTEFMKKDKEVTDESK